MPSILDRLLGRKPAEEKKEVSQQVPEEVARARREELARKQQEAEAARKRAEESEKARLAALEQEKMQKIAAEEKARVAAKPGASWAQAAPAQAQAAATTPSATERSYVVKSGDSLSKIAKELYGEAKRWPEIYEANKQLIGDNPNLIHPGQKLRIP